MDEAKVTIRVREGKGLGEVGERISGSSTSQVDGLVLPFYTLK